MDKTTNASLSRECGERQYRNHRRLNAGTGGLLLGANGRRETQLAGPPGRNRDDPWRTRVVRKVRLLAAALLVTAFAAGCAPKQAFMPPSTAPFLGPKDFSGTYTPRSSNATTGGQATYFGNIVFTNISRNIVEAALPPELRLADNVSATPDLHPVVYLYGHPRDTSWIIWGVPYDVGQDYEELMILIPFVQTNNGTKWHNYALRTYLDDAGALIVGNTFFAYAKEMGTSQESGTQFTEFYSSIAYFQGDIQTVGTWQTSTQAESTLPNYKAIQTIFEMPIVGRSFLGTLICSYFELNYTSATVAPVQSQHEFQQPFTPATASWVALGSLSSVQDGAIAIENLQWRIKHPPPPGCRF